MRRFTVLPLLVTTIFGLFVGAAQVRAWESRIEESRTSARMVVVDPAGDVIAAGTVSFGSDVVKLSGATGQVIWRSQVMGHESRNYVQDLAVDSRGDLFVVFAWTSVVIKISGADGSIVWRRPVGGTMNALLPIIKGVVVDRAGDVITAGTMGGLFNVCKLDGTTGDEEWHYDARAGYANDVMVDSKGDVAAVGQMSNYFATVKLRGTDGREVWHVTQGDAYVWGADEARAVAIDGEGNVVAAGVTVNEGPHGDRTKDFTVVKYATIDGEGGAKVSRAWEQITNGRNLGYDDRCNLHNSAGDEAYDVAVDGDGNVIAAGTIELNKVDPKDCRNDGAVVSRYFQVYQFSASGELIGGGSIPDGGDGRAFAVSVDPDGDIFAAGIFGYSFTIAKFANRGSTGDPMWVRQIGQGSNVGATSAFDVMSDARGNVAAAGETTGYDRFSRFTVVKLGPDGTHDLVSPAPPPPDTVIKYAPMVYLHPEDDFRPGNPSTFIQKSKLAWSHQSTALSIVACRGDDHDVAARHTVDAAMLGAASSLPYAHSPLNHTNLLCRDYGDELALKASDYTRPFDGSKRDNILGELEGYMKEGFYLDPSDDPDLRAGTGDGAPVFYEYVKGKYVTYWFFYPYNLFRIENPEAGYSIPSQAHEGDWERVSIQLDETDSPVNVLYYAHHGGTLVPWSRVDKFDGTHPIVFSAKGSHGSFPVAGEFPTEACIPFTSRCALDRTDYGPRWMTWTSLLQVEAQPWYGFGGAWGEVGEVPTEVIGVGLPVDGAEYTGPVGPSKYKNSRNQWLLTVGGRVTEIDGRGMGGAVLTLADAQGVVATALTDETGRYDFAGLTFGHSYTITPSKQGSAFFPLFRSFPDLRKNQTADFQAADTTPPVLSLPGDVTEDARDSTGAIVYYKVTATDDVTPSPQIECSAPSGVIFPIGTSTVTCTAIDGAGNKATGSFRAVVRGAAEQLVSLTSLVLGLNIHHGTKASLLSQLQGVSTMNAQGQVIGACNALKAFQNHVRAQGGKQIPAAQAVRLTASANQISLVIGCR